MQAEIAECELCKTQFREIAVNCPPSRIPPETISPPEHLQVLFVGVAPPEKGRNFYTEQRDNLRRGLFSVIGQLGYPCHNINDFLQEKFFLLHSAKCAIKGTSKPSSPVSQFCAIHYLKREIEQLLPVAVCWLSKNVGYDVCYSLCRGWGVTAAVPFGEVFSVPINGHGVHFIATNWPGRGWEVETKSHVEKLFRALRSTPSL